VSYFSTYNESLRTYGHNDLAALESYPAFREALAALVDESNAPLGRFLATVRDCALTSPFGSPCPACGITSWPLRGKRGRETFTGTYHCQCGKWWRSEHEIGLVNWRADELSGHGPTQQNRKPTS
jgi:hypothetical protein